MITVMMASMDTNTLLAAIDEEIQRLQQAKALLAGNDGIVRRGRPATPATAFSFGSNKPRKKRVLSAAARAKIRAAQKKRWAEYHKTHPKKTAEK